MSLAKKFNLITAISGLLVAVMAVVGYYFASKNLAETLEAEMNALVAEQAQELNGWLMKKAASAEYAANIFTGLNGDMSRIKSRDLLAIATSDKDILEVTIGLDDGYFVSYNAGDYTGKVDPTGRPWYKGSREYDKVLFTDAYVDVYTGQLIVSAAAPIKANGKFIGSMCNDIALTVLDEQVKKMNYRGQGEGIIIETTTGSILATSKSDAEGAKKIEDIPSMAAHFDEMKNKHSGFFTLPATESYPVDSVFAYTTIETTGWIVGISVDSSFVYAAENSLRNMYLILFIGILVALLVIFRKMALSVTTPIIELQAHAGELARGNLKLPDVAVKTEDEIGSLARAFNDMSKNLRNVISKMATTSDQVAAASEELTASAQQSAHTSVHVAESVGEVSMNMNAQLEDINAAKNSVDIVFRDIEQMSEKTKVVTHTSNETAQAAQRGSELMRIAVGKMGNIEKSVLASAEVVKQLGENSQQIGQIVEAISAIAEQTNLLALNAAIESARAGEQGRGFAVVAEEVRKLASESQTSAEQIREKILSIQSDTLNAVESMENGTKDVKEGTAAISEVGEQFRQIMKRVDEIKEQMGGIGTSMKTVSDGASKIVEAVESIDEVSRKTSEHTTTISASTQEQSASNEEIAAASQSLSHLATEMQEAVGKFKI